LEKDVLDIFNESIVAEAISKWLGNLEKLKLLRQVENFVYEFDDGIRNFILRITHSSHRSRELIGAELH